VILDVKRRQFLKQHYPESRLQVLVDDALISLERFVADIDFSVRRDPLIQELCNREGCWRDVTAGLKVIENPR
jgi:hypothetical protein